MPEPTAGAEELKQLRPSDFFPCISEVINAVFARIQIDAAITIDEDLFAKAYRKHLEAATGVEWDDIAKSGLIVRSSSQWTASEAHGQKQRLRRLLEENIRRGFFPGMLVADSASGTVMNRPGLLAAIEAGLEGSVCAYFTHTLERFSRDEQDGVSMLILIHWITGLVYYLSTAEEGLFVSFDSRNRKSRIRAADEILEGAKEGRSIFERFVTGARGVLAQERMYIRDWSLRIFFAGERTRQSDGKLRGTPEKSKITAGTYIAMAHVLTETKRPEAWDSFAFWFDLRKTELEQQMCSEWIRGNLVLAMDDWQAGKGFTSDERPPETIVDEMVVAPARTLSDVRSSFMVMRTKGAIAKNSYHLGQAKQLDAFRKQFNEILRHLASGSRRPFFEPGGSIDPALEVWRAGRHPIFCPVCDPPAACDLLVARRGNDFEYEAVCSRNAEHRGPPLLQAHIATASKRQRPGCPQCRSDCKSVAPKRIKIRTQVYRCMNGCPEPVLLPFAFNPALRMQWIEEDRLAEAVATELAANGWPAISQVDSSEQLIEAPSLSEQEWELMHVDQGLSRTPLSELRAPRGGIMPNQNSLRLRWLIRDDAERGVMQPMSHYAHWAERNLGMSAKQGWSMAGWAFRFWRKMGLDLRKGDRQDRSSERADLRGWMEADLEKDGKLRPVPHYMRRLGLKYKTSKSTRYGLAYNIWCDVNGGPPTDSDRETFRVGQDAH